jgi:hypothetical protein
VLRGFGCQPVSLRFDLDRYEGLPSDVARFRHMSGWLMVCEMTLATPLRTNVAKVLACCTDYEEIIPAWRAERLLQLGCALPDVCAWHAPDFLEEIADTLYWDFLGSCDVAALKALGDRERQTESIIAALESTARRAMSTVEAEIAAWRAERRAPDCSANDRVEILAFINALEANMEDRALNMIIDSQAMRAELAEYEDATFDGLRNHGTMEPLYVAHWHCMSAAEACPDIRLPLFQEEPYGAPPTEGMTLPSGSLQEALWR